MIEAIKVLDYINEQSLKKFWDKVNIPDNRSQCWIWTGATKDKNTENHYGVINLPHNVEDKYSTIAAHRFSYVVAHGTEPKATIDHLCFNKSCVNPSHLRDLSWSENAALHEYHSLGQCRNGHTRTKHNTTYQRGDDKPLCLDCSRLTDKARYKEKYAKEKLKYNHTSEIKDYNAEPKLTWEQVCEIREKYLKPEYSQSKLAIEYNVSKTNISLIVNNKTRKEK